MFKHLYKITKIILEIDSFNIGGGFSIKISLSLNYNYEYIVNDIVCQIKKLCKDEYVEQSNIYTAFRRFTVEESDGIIYKVLF